MVPPLIPIVATASAMKYGWYLSQPREKQDELDYKFGKYIEDTLRIHLTTQDDAVTFANEHPEALEEFKNSLEE